MFANTLTFTVNAVPKVLTRVIENPGSSVYRLREATGTIQVSIKQSNYSDSKRKITVDRHSIEMVHTIFPIAPNTIPEVRKSYTVIENDAQTMDIALTRNISKALGDFVVTPANADMLLAGEY